MSSYRLSESFCAKAPLPGLILVVVLAAPLAPLVFISVMSAQPEIDQSRAPPVMLIAIPMILLLISASLYINYRRKRAVLQKFRLFLEGDCLTRTAPGLADLSIFRDEVVEVVEMLGAGLAIFPKDRRRGIFIPAGLIGYDEVRETLSQWKEISVQPKRQYRRWAAVFGLPALLVGMGAATYILESPYLVAPLGSAFISFLLYCLWVVERSPQLDRRTKLAAWMVVLPIFSIAGKMAIACGLFGRP